MLKELLELRAALVTARNEARERADRETKAFNLTDAMLYEGRADAYSLVIGDLDRLLGLGS
jgi:hypothetical protein